MYLLFIYGLLSEYEIISLELFLFLKPFFVHLIQINQVLGKLTCIIKHINPVLSPLVKIHCRFMGFYVGVKKGCLLKAAFLLVY